MTTWQIVLLVLGILAVQVVLWIPLLAWIKRRLLRIGEALTAEIAGSGERIVRAPEPGVYRGGSGRWPRVKGNCVVALTDRRLVFRKVIGAGIDVPAAEIASAREERWFMHASTGRMHVVVKLESGDEVGFYVQDNAAWLATLQGLASRPAAQV